MKKASSISGSTLLAATLLTGALAAGETIDGRWDGVIQVLGTDLGISVRFETTDDGLAATIDIPVQNARDIALTNVRYEPPKVHFELQGGAGLAVFDGELEGEAITGEFTQAGVVGAFSLKRAAHETVEEAEPADEAPTGYNEEDVVFKNREITLAGTLTTPLAPGPHPAVVMISGSGPQNRDEDLFGFKLFKIIADHLTTNGIAVLRYDDRGVGGSSGSLATATSEDFAGDVLAAHAFLQTRTDIDPDKIGFIGHSEGGIVAPLAAASRGDDVAFLVLLAGYAITGEELLYAQIEALLRASGATDETIESRLAIQRRVFAALRTDEGWDELEEELRTETRVELESMPAEQREAIQDIDAFVEIRVNAQLTQVRTPWFRYFVAYDPVPALKEAKMPVLALFGELDLQVPPDATRESMSEALEAGGNKDYTIVVLPDANHLFQAAETGSPSEYATLKKEFVPGFLDLISDWILERTEE